MSLDHSTQVVLAIGLALIMLGIGGTLTGRDFLRVLHHPRAILAGLFAQLVGLPLVALITIYLFGLPVDYALGLLIIATSPGGPTSNLFSHLARADVALSVSLTACSNVLAIVTIPTVLASTASMWLERDVSIRLPLGQIILHLAVLVLVPLVLGMGIRSRWPNRASSLSRLASRLSVVVLIVAVAYVFASKYGSIVQSIRQLGLAVSCFSVCAIAMAALVGRLLRLHQRQRRTIVFEAGIQNGAQAIVIATSPLAFADPDKAVPAIVYSVLMYLFAFAMLGVFRARPAAG